MDTKRTTSAARIAAAVLGVLLAVGLGGPAAAQDAPVRAAGQVASLERTPPRLGYLDGEVSFWRAGAADWTPVRLNTPLVPGDSLYTGAGGTVEIEIGPRAFVRAAGGTQLGLDALEPDYLRFRVTAGHAALDVRDLASGHIIEIGTPHGAFTTERPGYYRLIVSDQSTILAVHRGGRVMVTISAAADSQPAPLTLSAGQQVTVVASDPPRVETGPAPGLSDWDRWNYSRTDQVVRSTSARYVSPGVYGLGDLDRYGTWRSVPDYGPVWLPHDVPADWAPYTTGSWVWDPYYGWTWVDEAPWGWAPYHYGRWVHLGTYWAWAPGPIVVRPVYAPALVAFFGGPVIIGRPVAWCALGWGEPLIPWWGRPGFVGVPWWGGWGGPRIVNNAVINRTTVVHAHQITRYRNAQVRDAMVAVPAEHFGQGPVRPRRLPGVEVARLDPVRGALEVKPTAASLVPETGRALRPPENIQRRPVVVAPSGRARVGTVEPRAAAPAPAAAAPGAPAPIRGPSAPAEQAAPTPSAPGQMPRGEPARPGQAVAPVPRPPGQVAPRGPAGPAESAPPSLRVPGQPPRSWPSAPAESGPPVPRAPGPIAPRAPAESTVSPQPGPTPGQPPRSWPSAPTESVAPVPGAPAPMPPSGPSAPPAPRRAAPRPDPMSPPVERPTVGPEQPGRAAPPPNPAPGSFRPPSPEVPGRDAGRSRERPPAVPETSARGAAAPRPVSPNPPYVARPAGPGQPSAPPPPTLAVPPPRLTPPPAVEAINRPQPPSEGGAGSVIEGRPEGPAQPAPGAAGRSVSPPRPAGSPPAARPERSAENAVRR